MLEVLLEVVLDRQRGEDGVVDQCAAQVSQRAGRVLPVTGTKTVQVLFFLIARQIIFVIYFHRVTIF